MYVDKFVDIYLTSLSNQVSVTCLLANLLTRGNGFLIENWAIKMVGSGDVPKPDKFLIFIFSSEVTIIATILPRKFMPPPLLHPL